MSELEIRQKESLRFSAVRIAVHTIQYSQQHEYDQHHIPTTPPFQHNNNFNTTKQP